VNLEAALAQTTPTRTQWIDWTRREPMLAGLTYEDVRSQLRTGTQQRKDDLTTLVRIARAEPEAFGVLAASLLPGLRHRVARYAPSLERQEAFAIMVAALYERVAAHAVDDRARFVAGRLLSLPTARLRRAMASQRTWAAQVRNRPDRASRASVVELSPATMLATAVDAGVIAEQDARLIFATRSPVDRCARRLGGLDSATRPARSAANAPKPAGPRGGHPSLSACSRILAVEVQHDRTPVPEGAHTARGPLHVCAVSDLASSATGGGQ
jgi:hypothetical protein